MVLKKKVESPKSIEEKDIVSSEENIIEEEENEGKNPSTILLNGVVKLVSEKYGLSDDYTITKFAEGNGNAKVTLASRDFDVSIEVRGASFYQLKEKLGLIED